MAFHSFSFLVAEVAQEVSRFIKLNNVFQVSLGQRFFIQEFKIIIWYILLSVEFSFLFVRRGSSGIQKLSQVGFRSWIEAINELMINRTDKLILK